MVERPKSEIFTWKLTLVRSTLARKDDAQIPHILNSNNKLTQNDSRFLLFNTVSDLEQNTQIKTICIFLHHVDILTCLDCLMQSHRVFTLHNAMDTYFLMDAVQVLLTDITNLNDLASVNLLSWVHSRSDSLLFSSIHILKEIRCKLSLAHFTILSLTKDIIDENNEAIDLSDCGLISLPFGWQSANLFVIRGGRFGLALCTRITLLS